MNRENPILEISDYCLSYAGRSGDIRILDSISLQIEQGEVLGLVGESGSAKSSLANAIMRDLPGRIAAESGEIRLGDTELLGMSEHRLQQIRGRRIAMVLQNAATALNPTMSVGQQVIETLRKHRAGGGADLHGRAIDALEQVGLPDPAAMMRRHAHEMSGGEKQRVVLAMALMCQPDLILFDEPTSALDATNAANFLDLFGALQKRTGVSGLFISHDLGVVSSIADRVAVIYGGRIVEIAETDTLFRSPTHPYTRALLDSLARPSDTRTGRQLAATTSLPALRSGPRPACTYALNCPAHESSVCDQAPVLLEPVESAGKPSRHSRLCQALSPERNRNEEPFLHRVACIKPEAFCNTVVTPARHVESVPSEIGAAGSVLAFHSLTVRYGRTGWFDRWRGRFSTVHAVNDVSLDVARGETLALVGESGCGKSTLARALAGLVNYQGELLCHGERVRRMDRHYRARVQMIFQNPDSSLNPRHSIRTILERPLVLYRREVRRAERSDRVAELLERVQLPAHYAKRYPHELSGGEKQRVAIARALAAEPDLIICDEITSGLDANVQASIVRLLKQIQQQSGTALIFITHDLSILRHLAQRVAVMYLGELVEVMDISALDAPPYHPYTEALLSSSPSIDPLTETRRVRLHGNLPGRSKRVSGCAFASRCQHRLGEQCATQTPPRRVSENGHQILCHIDQQTLSTHAPVWCATDNRHPS